MRRPWKEYVAPNGKKYYYNTETKETQWDKPVFQPQQKNVNQQSSGDLQGSSLSSKVDFPVYVIPLSNDWKLVIWSNGSKFYIDPLGKSHTELNDSDSLELLDYINRDKLILLVGFARGYVSSNIDPNIIYDQILEEIEQTKQDLQGDKDNTLDSDNNNSGSQDTKEVEEHVKEEDLEQQRQLISDLNEVDESSNIARDTNNKNEFIKLFDGFNLDKYSTWRIEMKKIESQPSFFLIENDNEREQLFEAWCSNSKTAEVVDNENVSESDSSVEESDEEELEPTKYHYLSHIISKGDIASDTIYQDIRTQNKVLFKEFKIKEFVPSRKEQEQFTSQLLFYYKKFDVKERTKLFVDLLNSNRVQLTQSLQTSLELNNKVQLPSETQFQTLLEENDSFEIETTLLKLEQLISTQGLLDKLTAEPTYYVIGIKDKTIELFNFLNHLVNVSK
ncbi:similar to Saccharomyces cerevisiae YPR152C URN1 Putative protein of unknown function containing WW and FF domains [Maudiozyma saulgeensis]|uniref:WW domain-containing protein n=1 Tax=Maudiozyma saulgeensis TaxID=1789683 RepID=A0A1X7QWW8_9SACH|nr:similar to Saccharomyces cerevisiae YPR152C URN1 Putative protein of unknown function containing WW and FF domains [Kazachstania saulgeensis]